MMLRNAKKKKRSMKKKKRGGGGEEEEKIQEHLYSKHTPQSGQAAWMKYRE